MRWCARTGWDDLLRAGLEHGFHETRQGVRYTIGTAARQEILDRLLELNHERYAREVKAGLHDKRQRRRATRRGEHNAVLIRRAWLLRCFVTRTL
jgi:hypothetical protein